MFRVVDKKTVDQSDIDRLESLYLKDVYDVKVDHETNQLMFLIYDNGWIYVPADDYVPLLGGVVVKYYE